MAGNKKINNNNAREVAIEKLKTATSFVVIVESEKITTTITSFSKANRSIFYMLLDRIKTEILDKVVKEATIKS